MDSFLFAVNSFCLAAQGIAQLLFAGALTGNRPRIRHFAFYLCALALVEWLGLRLSLPVILSIGIELFILYGVLRLVPVNRRSVALIAAVLALYFTQLSFGVIDSIEMLLFPDRVPDIWIRPLVALFTLAALALCTLYAYRRIHMGFEARAALACLAQAAESQKNYLAEAQTRYEQTRAFRHDLQNHLAVLGGLLNRGKISESRDYLQKLAAVSVSLSFPCHTGNSVADILLSEKLGIAKAKGIAAEFSLTLPESIGIDSLDLCVILANALDNALHACEAVCGDKWIRIRGMRQGDFYLLAVENSCVPGPMPPMGTGLSNIRAAVEKYGGTMQTEKHGPVYSLDLLVNIS